MPEPIEPEPRIASLPDEPDAPLVRRLLLALGLDLADLLVEDRAAAQDLAVELAVKFRNEAHRAPMITEDWAAERSRREDLESLVELMMTTGLRVIRRTDGEYVDGENDWTVAIPDALWIYIDEIQDTVPEPCTYEVVLIQPTVERHRTYVDGAVASDGPGPAPTPPEASDA